MIGHVLHGWDGDHSGVRFLEISNIFATQDNFLKNGIICWGLSYMQLKEIYPRQKHFVPLIRNLEKIEYVNCNGHSVTHLREPAARSA